MPPVVGEIIKHEWEVATASFKRRVRLLVGASVVLDVVLSGVAFVTERGARNEFKTYWDAMFWVTTQLLTVSSQLPNPENTATKFVDIVLEAWGVFIVAAGAGIIGDLLHHRTRHRAWRLRQSGRNISNSSSKTV